MKEIRHRTTNAVLAEVPGDTLAGGNLAWMNLRGADLWDADLRGADLSDDTVMPGGETWRVYREVVVYDLLRAGGRTVREIAEAGAWDCHAWENCPMAVAFGVHGPDDVPALYAPRVKEFVALFDADLLGPWVLVAALAREQAEQAP